MTRVLCLLLFTAASTSLSACSLFGSNDANPLQVQNVGPSIKEVLKPLPKDLVGDEDNKLYGFDELRPADDGADTL